MNADLLMQRDALADTVKRFAEREIAPNVQAWDDAGEFPRGLYRRAAELGLLGLGVSGEKVFITSGVRANWLTVAVRTGGPGAQGLSMIVVPGDAPGVSRLPLQKMGWWCSDTAQIRFDEVRVPVQHRVGDEGAGFKAIMDNFNGERLALAAASLGFAQACFDEALGWARQRQTFGAPLVERQVIRIYREVKVMMIGGGAEEIMKELAARQIGL